ncbi:MAG: hypothetical protein JEZ02_08570 [Desulfatibacillum sp.]|nr:hypothetical protein [Desulfatibacillum sp.]
MPAVIKENDFLMEEEMDEDTQVGEGIVIKSTEPLYTLFLQHMVKSYQVYNARTILPEKGRPLVVIAAHGPLWAPTPIMFILSKYFVESGYGDLVASFYPHPLLMKVPGMKAIFGRLGVPTKVYDLKGLVERLQDGRIHITGTAPEGIYCNFQWENYVGPYDNAGMVAAAVLTDAKLVLLAHQGGDAWNFQANLPFGWSLPIPGRLRGLNIPIGPVKKIDRYAVLAKRYRPALKKRELENKSPKERKLLIGLEVEKIRTHLNLMTEDLHKREAKKK